MVAGRIVTLELGDELRPPWLPAPGELRLWLERQIAAPRAHDRVLAYAIENGGRKPAIVAHGKKVTFAFDPEEAIAALLDERYLVPRRPVHTYVSLPYRWVPGDLRLRLFGWLVPPSADTSGRGFPHWPADGSADALRWVVARARGTPFPSPWPEGKRCAFAVSHDVDTAQGLRLVGDVSSFEAGLGLRSSWFVVGKIGAAEPSPLDALREQGHEIGLHGDVHDNTLAYQSREEIRRRLSACQPFIERHHVIGFRSPSLLETPTLREELATSFRYASQVPDTEIDSLIGPRRGCCTCFPFLRRGLVEIPITLPFEDKLILRRMSEDDILTLWRRKAARVKEVGGVIQLAIHNEPHLLRRCRAAYESIVREMVADSSVWTATLREVADRWDQGSRMA